MTPILTQQKQLLEEKINVLQRLDDGLQWSLERLPELDATNIEDPAISERVSAIVDRFCKLQDQLAGALRHAHAMLGEKSRNFQDVVRWAVSQDILANQETWLELRGLRNRLTHEYDLESGDLPELMELVRQDHDVLRAAIARFVNVCKHTGLARN